MKNEPEIREYLDKIVNSNAFSLSGVYKKLLEYLTEETLKGEKPKEFTIGHAIFHQNVDDPGSSRVRVSVYKLRKRLEKYYKEEGADDKIRFSIPKGGYSLEFNPNVTDPDESSLKRNDWPNRKNLMWIGAGMAAILVAAAFFYFITKPGHNKLKKTSFWNELIHNKKETVIIT